MEYEYINKYLNVKFGFLCCETNIVAEICQRLFKKIYLLIFNCGTFSFVISSYKN